MWSEGTWLGRWSGGEGGEAKGAKLAWWPNIVEFYFGGVLVWVRGEGVLAR